MDFLDSLDLNVSYKKSRRVRSWYLYEQYKALERNQLDATRQLKDRSYQDRILRQELYERKARRKLYHEPGLSRAESCSQGGAKSDCSLNASRSGTFKSFHELCDDGLDNLNGAVDACSRHDSQKFYDNYDPGNYGEDFKSINEQPNDSYAESTISVVAAKSDDTVTELEKYKNGNKKIHIDLDEVKEKLQCLEKLTKMRDYDRSSTNETLYSSDEKEREIVTQAKNVNTNDNNIYMMWSRLVSFAYQLMQLNHGSCYYDYGSQFLTAVLACDVLRRGINRMCYILQPYVSPIKFATDSVSSITHKNVKRKKSPEKWFRKDRKHKKIQSRSIFSKSKYTMQAARKYNSEDFWSKISPRYRANCMHHHKYRRRSEPWDTSPASPRENPLSKSSYQTIWPDFSDQETNIHRINKSSSKELDHCSPRKVINPMLELSRYLDKIMKDIEEPSLI